MIKFLFLKNKTNVLKNWIYLSEKEVPLMKKYKCKVCGYVYDPEAGEPRRDTPPGTPFEDLKNNWHCPQCGAGLNRFVPK